MWKKIFIGILFFSLAGQALPQKKNLHKVKRKYQQTEIRSKTQPEVKVFGRVQNTGRERLPGAKVTVFGTRFEVHTNENGEYFLKGMQTGRVRLVVTYAGYQTKYIDYFLQEGVNNVYFTLDRSKITLHAMPVSMQLRNQQVPDVPSGLYSVYREELEENSLTGLEDLSRIIPFYANHSWSSFIPEINIRGISNESFPVEIMPPRISVSTDGVPVDRFNAFSAALYDIDRIEVLRGPQNTLFGGGGVSGGAIHIFPRKPAPELNGYISSSLGELNSKELQLAVNVPVVKNKLSIRTASDFSVTDGYIHNSFGGKLNGNNTMGGRMTIQAMPFWNTKINLMLTFQKDKMPGTAMINPDYPNSKGEKDLFTYETSLNNGKNLKDDRDLMGASLEIKRFRNPNNYLVSNSSFYTSKKSSLQDGDGTLAPAIEWSDKENYTQWTQEIRYDYSKKGRTNGSLGGYYSWFGSNKTVNVSTNEQYMAYLIYNLPQLVSNEGKMSPLQSVPEGASFGQWAGLVLPADRVENNLMISTSLYAEIFMDVTWRLSARMCFTAGIRESWEWNEVTFETPEPAAIFSTLGNVTGKFPNLFYKPVPRSKEIDNQGGISYRTNLKIDLAENTVIYAGVVSGRNPSSIRFNTLGESRIINPEIVNSVSAGYKSAYGNRIWTDISGYYQNLRNFRTIDWNNFDYIIHDTGNATVFGAEAAVKAILFKNLAVFGNYAFAHARFSRADTEGTPQYWTGDELKLTPEHCLTAGIRVGVKISSWAELFGIPVYSWKSHLWFDDANTPGMEQQTYGILNATAGIDFPKSGITLSCSGTNLLEEKYLAGGGYPGMLFHVPLVVPGAPRMLKARIVWRF
jgi:iron complex outermembrane recepter protein